MIYLQKQGDLKVSSRGYIVYHLAPAMSIYAKISSFTWIVTNMEYLPLLLYKFKMHLLLEEPFKESRQ